MWTLYIDDDESNRTVLKLGRGSYTIGRAEDNGIRLTERNVSRHHARLDEGANGRWQLTDLGSDNGCFINGRRITDPVVLAHGDFVQVGDYRLRMVDNDIVRTQPEVEDDTLRQVPGGPGSEPVDRLVVLAGPSVGVAYPLHAGSILLGRGEECEIALPDTSVSRVHAEVVGSDTGYELIDRGSANGLNVNGVALTRTFLEPGDVIELGDVLLKLVPKGEIFVPSDVEAVSASDPTGALMRDSTMPEPRKRWPLFASGGALGGLLLAFLVLQGKPASEAGRAPLPEQEAPSAAERVVEEAVRLYRAGNLSEAHDKLRELPPQSNLRQSAAVLEVERGWADTIFDAVEREPSITNKKALLTEIATTEGINSAQRKRAAYQLEQLQTPSVDVTDLPTENAEVTPPAPATTRPAPRPRPASAPIAKAPTPVERPAPAPEPKTPPPEPKKPAEEDGLIRKLPF